MIEPTSSENKPVNVIVDKAELEEIKRLTGVDANAPAILCAARKGVQLLKRMQEVVEHSFSKGE